MPSGPPPPRHQPPCPSHPRCLLPPARRTANWANPDTFKISSLNWSRDFISAYQPQICLDLRGAPNPTLPQLGADPANPVIWSALFSQTADCCPLSYSGVY